MPAARPNSQHSPTPPASQAERGRCDRLLAATLLLAALLVAPALAAQDFSQPDSEPAPGAALIQQANDALAASDFAAAFKILTSLNTQTPNNPQVLYDLGLTLEALAPPKPRTQPPAPPATNPSNPPSRPSPATARPSPPIPPSPPRTSRSACCSPAPTAPPKLAPSSPPQPQFPDADPPSKPAPSAP